jgi:hypothetical protein
MEADKSLVSLGELENLKDEERPPSQQKGRSKKKHISKEKKKIDLLIDEGIETTLQKL